MTKGTADHTVVGEVVSTDSVMHTRIRNSMCIYIDKSMWK